MRDDKLRGLGMMGVAFSGSMQQCIRHAAETEAAIAHCASVLGEPIEDVTRVVRHMTGTTLMTTDDACDALIRDARAWGRWQALEREG